MADSTLEKLAQIVVDSIPTTRGQAATKYGTVTENNGQLYVKIDGSDQLTPVKSTTSYKSGERVVVRIENHKALVTGNLSDVAATSNTVSGVESNLSNQITDLGIVVAEKATIEDLNAANANIKTLTTDYATVKGNLEAAQADITNLQTDKADITDLTAATGRIDTLESTTVTTDVFNTKYATVTGEIEANQADIRSLKTDYADVTTKLTAAEADIDSLEAKDAEIDKLVATKADISDLEANYAHITDGVIDNAKIGYANVTDLDAHYASIDLANVDNAWIEKGVVKNAAISDAQISGVSANKITTGELDASKVTVTNLNATNITTGALTVGGMTIDVTNNKAEIDGSDVKDGTITLSGLSQDVRDEIDGNIETWTITTVPTLNNDPASKWTDDDTKDKHVGDIAYVVNASDSADGWTYRFTKDSSGTYSWTLIRDNQVTAALSRLTQAEGDIDGLVDFKTETSSWIEKTDEGMTSLRTRTTEMETLVDAASSKADDAMAETKDLVTLRIDSSRGTVFKNSDVSTVLTVHCYKRGTEITTLSGLREAMGDESARVRWSVLRENDTSWVSLDDSDPLISQDGFTLTLTPDDIDIKCTFKAEIVTD